MLFTEFRFFAFFALTFLVHWMLRGNGPRKRWLLVCSYAFYSAWDWRFLSLILISTVVDFTAGMMLGRERAPGGRRTWLTASLITNLGLLGIFKYFNFFIESGAGLFDLLGLDFPARTMSIVLPVGISFYTFQTLSYTIDIYRGNLKPIRSFLDFALFVGFFPQLVAGPIVRAVEFLPQLETKRVLASVNFRACFTLFVIGFVKKACISDNLAPIVDRYFADPAAFDVGSAWVAGFYYFVQFYCDFSGYSDMAIASAGMLGYKLPLNFNFPFFARNIGEFWHRWHITLSFWLRDYLYIPTGGNKGSKLFHYRNLMISFVLCGLWHGAGWNYVLFGFIHGIAVLVRVEWNRHLGEMALSKVFGALGAVLTFCFISGSLIVFRPNGVEPTLTALRAYFLFSAEGDGVLAASFLWVFPSLVAVHWVAYKRWLSPYWRALPNWLACFLLGAGFALALQFAAKDYQPFLYFQF